LEISNFEKFWQTYPNRKGKKAAEKAFMKASKGEDEGAFTEMICSAVDAQKRYRRDAESSGEFIPNWKMPATWINSGCWDDEIKSHSELKEKLNLSVCTTEGCDKPVHGSKYTKCSNHTQDSRTDFNAEKREYLRSHGVTMKQGESMADYAKKCREHLKLTNPDLERKFK